MSDEEFQNEANQTELDEDQAQENAAGEQEAASQTQVLEAENAKLKDRLLRAVAEMENLRKRTERDVKDARQYAMANFARDMLTATDNLSRALMTMAQEAKDEAEGPFKSLIEGVEMTEREMHRLLEKNGITKLEPKGEKFDPNFHQAMFEIPNSDVAENTVMEVMQAGYVIGERVLRPAMVGVAKGGPKVVPINNGDDAAETGENLDRSV
ncbi:nucleotide exchange factor GrpE [Maritalea porphyrae]|jgi:molecular chaperone GrpE|uniref:nucleotide exchange factor GrpE n=1 Tax=Maritalea porphyrae TaxID=880732 RepID=UPI0022AF96AB|nr:nucleotide exchange factor GrpE [Maritalea porphyrae]MCZ4272220.1 nucleotide exchange factor GrpE [Maritalea porphyrae]